MSERSTVTQFAAKTAIVCAAVLVVLWVVSNLVSDIIEQRTAELYRVVAEIKQTVADTKIGGREFWTNAERALEKQAAPENELSPEKKKKILAEIRTISNRWRPFIQEVLQAAAPEPPTKP